MSGMYNVVSGVRRSGTSMLMLALKEMGVPIRGDKFGVDVKERQIEGNPNGYWELGKVTHQEGLTTKCHNVGKSGDTLKVMAEVMANSDPRLIDKVIVILRSPRNSIASMLKYNKIASIDTYLVQNAFDLIDTFGFLLANKKEFRVVFYEDILESPKREMRKICKFFRGKDYKKGVKVVDGKLNRSEEYRGKSKWIDILEDIYDKAKRGEIMRILMLEQELKNLAKNF